MLKELQQTTIYGRTNKSTRFLKPGPRQLKSSGVATHCTIASADVVIFLVLGGTLNLILGFFLVTLRSLGLILLERGHNLVA